MASSLSIRPAVPGDEVLILELIGALAEFERLAHEVEATQEGLTQTLFAPNPRVFCEIAYWGDDAVGFALWFYSYSTFLGRHGIFLEDLFVRPHFRAKGVGKALLSRLAARCVEEKLGRLEWAVLDWNERAIGFYRSQGAILRDDWTGCRVSGDALRRLAAQAG